MRKTYKTLLERYGKDYMKKLASEGGKKSRGGGFADPELAAEAGRKSKRNKRQPNVQD